MLADYKTWTALHNPDGPDCYGAGCSGLLEWHGHPNLNFAWEPSYYGELYVSTNKGKKPCVLCDMGYCSSKRCSGPATAGFFCQCVDTASQTTSSATSTTTTTATTATTTTGKNDY